MKAKESRLLAFLSSSKQFVIPIYQRPYRWEEAQCRKLWDDVLRAGAAPEGNAHFVGSVVYIQDGLYSVTDQPALLLIDGQQRLTTFLLLIEAIALRKSRPSCPVTSLPGGCVATTSKTTCRTASAPIRCCCQLPTGRL